jgi:hypothetical protein
MRASKNRAERRIFRPERDEVTGDWRKLHNEGLHNLRSLPSKIRMMKLGRMIWARHVARIGRRGMPIAFGGKARGKYTIGKTKA